MKTRSRARVGLNGKGYFNSFYRPDGKVYEGEWFNGRQHGVGVFTDAKGHTHNAEWRDGRRIRTLDEDAGRNVADPIDPGPESEAVAADGAGAGDGDGEGAGAGVRDGIEGVEGVEGAQDAGVDGDTPTDE